MYKVNNLLRNIWMIKTGFLDIEKTIWFSYESLTFSRFSIKNTIYLSNMIITLVNTDLFLTKSTLF